MEPTELSVIAVDCVMLCDLGLQPHGAPKNKCYFGNEGMNEFVCGGNMVAIAVCVFVERRPRDAAYIFLKILSNVAIF